MLLRSLEVQNFRLLRQARLTFGRGLNVLFGPNDLGKSSLAESLRAALLLPVGSSESREFVPWGTDLVPRVIVEFEAEDKVWRITKTFGGGARGTALLERVGDSGSLFEEARARAVEGKLRELLAWGIPGPGGKGAPRGFPDSYLTTALLGRQDQVTAILEASLEEDGVNTGRRCVENGLGALAQDPLVQRLMGQLEERAGEAFAPGGALTKGKNSPLVQLTNKIREQERRLKDCDDNLRRSEEIERKVQWFTDQQHRARDEFDRLERHLELLRAARGADDELQKLRAHDNVLEQARRALALAEAEAEERDATYKQVDAALRKADHELRAARERLAKASGTRDEVLKNVQSARDARRAELVAKREAAIRREQAARDVIQAREQVEARARELAQAEEAYQQALLAKVHAQHLAEFAELLAHCREANQAIQALKASQEEQTGRAANLSDAGDALKKGETALEDAEAIVVAKKDALARAERAAADRHVRREGLRASLIRAEAAEQEALQAVAQAKAAIASCERVREAEKSLAELEAHEQEVEARLAANTAEREACETARGTSKPLPIRPALVAALLGAATIAALGVGLKLDGSVVAAASVGGALVLAVLTTLVLRSRQLHAAMEVSRRGVDDLLKLRQSILEERNQVSVKRGVAQLRLDSLRSERDQAIERVPDPNAALKRAQLRLQQSQSDRDQNAKQLASFDTCQLSDGAVTKAHVEAAEQAVVLLKEEVKEKRRLRDEAQHRLAEAQVRVEAAKSSADSVDLAALQERLKEARLKVGEERAPYLDDAQTQLQLASDAVVELETAVKLTGGRLSDAQSRFDGLVAALEHSPDTMLAEAAKEKEDVEKALQGLDERQSSEIQAAENEFNDANARASRLEAEFTVARSQADEAMQAHDESQTKRHEARRKVDSLQQFMPSTTVAAAEAAFEQASRELECYSPGSTFFAEDLARAESLFEQRGQELRRMESELHAARGQLELVGGSVVREQRDQQSEALDGLRRAADDLELEFRATKRLLDVLKEAEAKHAAHLGRCLAKPVTDMFIEMAGTRYTQVVLEPTLRVRNLTAGGGERDLALLSVGTRDQLATLVRLALAAHLKSVVLLDDQLAQSDHNRLDWFRDRLRASVRDHQHQIIVITCRPLDYVHAEEMPAPSCDKCETEDGMLTVVDLERVVSCLEL